MIKSIAGAALLLLFFLPVLSAQSQISGTVLDAKNTAVVYANVLLLRAADTSLVRGAVTDDNGAFQINRTHHHFVRQFRCRGQCR